ncbi:unnamed protein product, partial [Porites lobata]
MNLELDDRPIEHKPSTKGSNYDLQLPLPKTNFVKRSFSYRGAMAWNQLSNET